MKTPETGLNFGQKLRKARKDRNLTLKQVATQAGVTESLISQIENGRVSPAMDTLLAIVEILDIDLNWLFQEYTDRKSVKITKATRHQELKEGKVTYQVLAKPDQNIPDNPLESYRIILPPGTKTRRGSWGHSGKETGLVLRGHGILTYRDREYQLDEGDTVQFSSTLPHSLENRGQTDLEVVWSIVP